jgi:uncharacterized membrane protein YfcA
MWSDTLASLSMTTIAALWGGAFLGGVASGAAGFAFGIAASAIWLHALMPIHSAFLVVAGGLVVQSGTIWTLRGSLDMRRLWPTLLAGIIGVPIGVWLLVHTDLRTFKLGIGTFLCVYGVYALTAPRLPYVMAGRGADTVIGLIGGILGGLGGYSGVLPAIWTQLRGWSKVEARAFYQPFIVIMHITTIAMLGAVAIDRAGLVLLMLALPVLVIGTWVGWRLYGQLNEKRFRQALAVMLLLSGAVLIL